MKTGKVLAVLFNRGGLGDVGRHAVRAALDLGPESVSKIVVLSSNPLALEELNWKCGCPGEHYFTNEERKRMEIVKIDVTMDDWKEHLRGADAVVSCLGNRQFLLGPENRVGKVGTEKIVNYCSELGIERVVVMSAMGIEEDWPAAEFHWGGRIMSCLFLTLSRKEFKDLTGVERAVRRSDLDYLIVRPVGLGEDVVPVGEWFLQKQKGVDVLGINLAKLDCGRFMVEEALKPSLHYAAVVVGAKEDK